MAYSISSGYRIYYGSQLVYQGNGTGRIDAGSPPLRIGARVDSLYTEYFKREIDDVRIWNIARSQCEIIQDMDQELTGSEPGLIAYYIFDEAAGSTAVHDTVTASYTATRFW